MGGAITVLFLALAASSNRLPCIANFFRSSRLNLCVPSLVLPRCICFFTEAWLLNDPCTDENESAELGGRDRSVVDPFLGVDWNECLPPTFRESGDAREDGLGILDRECFFVDIEVFLDFALKDVSTASESPLA